MASGKGTSIVAVYEELTLVLQRDDDDNEDCDKAKNPQHKTERLYLLVDDLENLISIGTTFNMTWRNWGFDFSTFDSDSSGSILFLKPVGSSLSNENALQRCIDHANLWLSKSEQQIFPTSDITYAYLRENLAKIIGLQSSINSPADDVGAAVALKSLCVEGSVTQCEEKGTHHESCTETHEDQSPVPKPEPEGTYHESCTEADEDKSNPTETHEDQSPVPKPEPEGDFVAPPACTAECQSDPGPDEDKSPVFKEEMLKTEDWWRPSKERDPNCGYHCYHCYIYRFDEDDEDDDYHNGCIYDDDDYGYNIDD